MNRLQLFAKKRFMLYQILGLLLLLIVLVSCMGQNVLPTTQEGRVSTTLRPISATATFSEPVTPALPPTSIPPTPMPVTPVLPPTSIPPTPMPTSVTVECELSGPYIGASNPGSVRIEVVNVTKDCKDVIPSTRRRAQQGFGGWLADGSGFLYLDAARQEDKYSINICSWDLEKGGIARCFVENGDNYLKAVQSPSAGYIAYERQATDPEIEYVTVANAESNTVVYETGDTLLDIGVSQRFLAWHPDGKHILIAEDTKTQQAAIIIDVETGDRQELLEFDKKKDYLAKGLWVENGNALVLGVIEPSLCCNSEFVPEARDLYWIRDNGKGSRQLLKDARVGRFFEDPQHDRLLIDTYSNSGASPMFWLDIQDGTLTRVFDDVFEKTNPLLMGITPDGKYIIALDGQYRTWLFNVVTGKFNQLSVSVLSPLGWRP